MAENVFEVWSTWGPRWFVRSSTGERVSPLFESEYDAVAWIRSAGRGQSGADRDTQSREDPERWDGLS